MMSNNPDKLQQIKRTILGDAPDGAAEKIMYARAEIALSDYIEIFEKTLADPQNMKANVTVLSLHLSRVASEENKFLRKMEEDMGTTIYSDAKERFVKYYMHKIPAFNA